MIEQLRPSQRIAGFKAASEVKERKEAIARAEVLTAVAALAIEYSEGAEAVIEHPRKGPGRGHVFTYTFEHEPVGAGAYRIGRRYEWAVGPGADEASWIFDHEFPTPIVDVVSSTQSRVHDIPGYNTWESLGSTVSELILALEQVIEDPSVTTSA